MLSKSQQVFASAYRDIQRLTWNFPSENSTKRMSLRTKQLTCSRKVVKLKRFWFTGRGVILGRVAIFFLLCLVISKREFVNKSFWVNGSKRLFLEVLFWCLLYVASFKRFHHRTIVFIVLKTVVDENLLNSKPNILLNLAEYPLI